MTIEVRKTKLPKYCKPKEGSKYTNSKYCVAYKTRRTCSDGFTVRSVWSAYHYLDDLDKALILANDIQYYYFGVVIYKMKP